MNFFLMQDKSFTKIKLLEYALTKFKAGVSISNKPGSYKTPVTGIIVGAILVCITHP